MPRPVQARLVWDFERFKTGMPADLSAHVREHYRVDLTGQYAGRRTRVPFGKASGQLSMTAADLAGHLGDAVLELTARTRVER